MRTRLKRALMWTYRRGLLPLAVTQIVYDLLRLKEH